MIVFCTFKLNNYEKYGILFLKAEANMATFDAHKILYI